MLGGRRGPQVENLSSEDVRKGLADNSILLVDVREPHEWVAGHIPGSILMPLSQFDATELPDAAGRRIVTTCRSGMRSLNAAALADQAGIAIDAHLAGGILDWIAQGFPVETGD